MISYYPTHSLDMTYFAASPADGLGVTLRRPFWFLPGLTIRPMPVMGLCPSPWFAGCLLRCLNRSIDRSDAGRFSNKSACQLVGVRRSLINFGLLHSSLNFLTSAEQYPSVHQGMKYLTQLTWTEQTISIL